MSVLLSEYTKYIDQISILEDELRNNCTSCDDCLDFIYKRGNIPVILSASQSICHIKNYDIEQLNSEKMYSGLIVQLLGRLSGAHVIYTNSKSGSNQTTIERSPFKSLLNKVVRENKIKLLIDIQGIVENQFDIDLLTGGVGRPNLKNYQWIYKIILDNFGKSNIDRIGDNGLSGSKSGVISNFASEYLNISSIQINISPKYRIPKENSLYFAKMLRALFYSLMEINNHSKFSDNSMAEDFPKKL